MPKKDNKVHVYNKTQEFFKKYKNIVIADVKDISTDKIQKIRHEIISLGETETLCGKTTVIQKAIHDMKEEAKGDLPKHLPEKALEDFVEAMPGIHLLVIFTNKDIAEISNITAKYIIEKQAKPGQISPVEIIIPAGPTGMDSSQIDYFQALKIPTKVMRNQLEITTATKILTVGQKITLSEINLMKKFNIKPYKHQMKIKKLLLNGKLYGEEILKVTNDYMKTKLEQGIKNVLGFSLAAHIPTQASAPHVISNAFRNICALSLGTNVLIDATKNMKDAPKEAPKKEEKPKKEEAPKKEEKPPEEEEEDIDLGGLF
jgi:large subunit ribosomal protein LP0